MNRLHTWFFLLCALVAILPSRAHAFPDAELIWSAGGGPPFSFGITSTQSGFILSSDRRLIVSYGEVVSLIDVGSFALEAVQPAALSVDALTDGIIAGIGFAPSQNQLLASQEDGDLLFFDMNDPAKDPTSVTLVTGDKLGPIVIDAGGRYAYVADNTSHQIHVIDLVTQGLLASVTAAIPNVTSFIFTDGAFSEVNKEAYFSTDSGAVFFLPSGGASVTMIDVGVSVTPRLSLPAIAAFPTGNALYVVDATTPSVRKIDPATHTISGSPIDIATNSSLTDVAITQVENPLNIYAYVAGAMGVNVIDTATSQLLDLGVDPDVNGEPMPMSAQTLLLAASSSTDGMVYAGFSTGGVGVITERPFVAVTSLTYSGGGSALTLGGSFELKFMGDTTGTYEIRSGGSVDAGGTLLVDNTGKSSGTVSAADTDVTVTINYADNVTAFIEGTNDIWIFLTGDTGRGRRATQITVDTPPPNVVIESTGFGSGKIYVNFDRLTVNDMASYNVYVDTDPAAVLTKSEVALSVAQPSSGSQVTAEVTGLTNGTTYYVAVEGVDTGGNVSLNRTAVLPDGSRASAVPELTAGPAGFSGEKGCALAGESSRPWLAAALFPAILFILATMKRKGARVAVALAMLLTVYSSVAIAAADESVEERNIPSTPSVMGEGVGQPWWSLEVKTGFWMPQSSDMDRFFSSCCNLVTRIQGSFLAQRRYGAELGVGFFYKSGSALSVDTGTQSQDHFTFMLIPIELSFVWRADYFDWRYLVPYAKAGFDGWVFRESVAGSTTKGIKFGMHGVGGLQINIGKIGDVETNFHDIGINDFFLTLEAQYQWINNFGGKGLDLSGPIFSAGFLFEF